MKIPKYSKSKSKGFLNDIKIIFTLMDEFSDLWKAWSNERVAEKLKRCGFTCLRCVTRGSEDECRLFSSSSFFLLLFLVGALSLSGRAGLLQRWFFFRSSAPELSLSTCKKSLPQPQKYFGFFTFTQLGPYQGAWSLLLFRAQAVIGQLAAGRGWSMSGR